MYLVVAVATVVLLATVLPAFASMEDDGVYQESVIGALVDGWYDGDITCAQLLDHGDLGLGTIDGVDGELVVLDGRAYVVNANGSVHQVSGTEGIPFANVCHFDVDMSFEINVADLAALESAIDSHVAYPGNPIAVRIMGSFSQLVCRSVPGQEHPYPPLAEVVANQTIFDLATSTAQWSDSGCRRAHHHRPWPDIICTSSALICTLEVMCFHAGHAR